MNPYSGLSEFFESQNLLLKDGNSWRYDFIDGTSIKQFRKEWNKNTNGCMDKAMEDFNNRPVNNLNETMPG